MFSNNSTASLYNHIIKRERRQYGKWFVWVGLCQDFWVWCTLICIFNIAQRMTIRLSTGEGEGEGERERGGEEKRAAWLKPLLETSFFMDCKIHGNSGRSIRCNIYCLDCIVGALCSYCVADHKRHNVVQVIYYIFLLCIALHWVVFYLNKNTLILFMGKKRKNYFLNWLKIF